MSSESVQQGWTPEEMQSFVTVEVPQIEEKPNTPSNDELLRLQQHSLAEQQRQTSLLQQELFRQRTPQTATVKPFNPLEKLPEKVRVQADDQGNLFLDPKDMADVSQRVVDKYHQDVVAPVGPLLDKVQQGQSLQSTIAWLKSEDPKLLEGRNPEALAGLATGLYESPLNPGRDDLSKSAYVLDNLRQMNLQSGNPSIRQAQPSNQVGRTLPGGSPQGAPYAPGAKINLNRTTAQEMGLDKYMDSIALERELRDYDAQHKMGWSFNIQRPR